VLSVTYLGRELQEGVDYRVLYGHKLDGTVVEAGTENIGVAGGTGYGYITVQYYPGSNFDNYDNMSFAIVDTQAKNDLASAELRGADTNVIFEGNASRPISVWYGGSQLTEGRDYTITYTDNDAPGPASFTVTAKSGSQFTGGASGSFTLVEGTPYDIHYTYNEQNDTAAVTGVTYNGVNETFELQIPETVEYQGGEYTVTSIGTRAFMPSQALGEFNDAQRISKVTIPKTVTTIESYAFSGSTSNRLENLAEVVFATGSQLASIGNYAFSGVGIETITIPASVSNIGRQAFDRPYATAPYTLQSIYFDSKSSTVPTFTTIGAINPFGNTPGLAFYAYEEASTVKAFYDGFNNTTNRNWTFNTRTSGEQVGTPGSGDFDGDGFVAGADILNTRRAAAGIITPSDSQFEAIDMDDDGFITGSDILKVRRKAAGLD
jgi:hypothetical protein